MVTLRFVQIFGIICILTMPSIFANKKHVVFPPREILRANFKEFGLEKFNKKTNLIDNLLNDQKTADEVIKIIRQALLIYEIDLPQSLPSLLTILFAESDPEAFQYGSRQLEDVRYEKNPDGTIILACKIFIDSYLFMERRFCIKKL